MQDAVKQVRDGKSKQTYSSGTTQLIGSLSKGLIIMEALMEHGSMGVTELGRLLGVNKSSAYRLLATLVAHNFVLQDSVTGKYRLSMRLSKFRMEAIDDVRLREVAQPFLKKLTEITNESAGLCVLAGDSGVLIDNHMSSEIITAKLNIGMDEPLYCTSLGKALLSVQPEVERERLIMATTLTPMTPKTIVDRDLLRLEIRRAAENGFAMDDEEYSLGMRCLAAPVFGCNGEPIASIGISGPITRMRTEIIVPMAANVKAVAQELSDLLDI